MTIHPGVSRLARIAIFLSATTCLFAQTPHVSTEVFTLPAHSGAMILNLEGFHTTQFSTKTQGREIGVRAHDAAHTELLAFLFLTPDNKAQTATSCLQAELNQIKKGNSKLAAQVDPNHTDTHEVATMDIAYPNGSHTFNMYAGAADQCLAVQVYADKGSTLNLAEASALLSRQHYDPSYVPTSEDTARYFTIQAGPHTAEVPAKAPPMLVTWYTAGGVRLPSDPAWKLTLITAYDHAGRPTAQFKNTATDVIASFIIFENLSGKPTSEGCRKDVMDGILKNEGPLVTGGTEGEITDDHGGTFATASHFLPIAGTTRQHDLFAFKGDKKVCTEIHVSTTSGKPDEDKRLADALSLFHPDLTYQPVTADYFALATAFHKGSLAMSAPYFDAALKTMNPDAKDAETLKERRIATDVVVIALGMQGNLKTSREYAERAIKLDPDYPLNYYNLACADAEQGNAKNARIHLQQAFDRRANTITGETMPDPTTDDAILKLKSNQEFWQFVQSLPGK